jgi:hypothetical protein
MTKQSERLESEVRREMKISPFRQIRMMATGIPVEAGVKVKIEVGNMKKESIIGADYFGEYFVPESSFYVVADNKTGKLMRVV